MALFKIISHVIPKTCTSQNRRYLAQLTHVKVTLCGASSQLGQPLSLLLKQSPFIDELALYDSQKISGLAMELGYMDTKCIVTAHCPANCTQAFDKANIVVIASGTHVYGKKAMESAFPRNAAVVQQIASHVAKICPQALIAVVTNPVESLVPVVSERLKFANVYNPCRVFGVTTLNVIRANTFSANVLGLEPECAMVPVVGGNYEGTIVPILSQALPCNEFTELEIENITKSLQTAHFDSETTPCAKGPTLANAFAIARFIVSLSKGLRALCNVQEYAFVRTNDIAGLKYFGMPIILGPGLIRKHTRLTVFSSDIRSVVEGLMKKCCLPNLSCYEGCLIEEAKPIIRKLIQKGNAFVGKIDLSDACRQEEKADQCEY